MNIDAQNHLSLTKTFKMYTVGYLKVSDLKVCVFKLSAVGPTIKFVQLLLDFMVHLVYNLRE